MTRSLWMISRGKGVSSFAIGAAVSDQQYCYNNVELLCWLPSPRLSMLYTYHHQCLLFQTLLTLFAVFNVHPFSRTYICVALHTYDCNCIVIRSTLLYCSTADICVDSVRTVEWFWTYEP
jgi:hypothetical protein